MPTTTSNATHVAKGGNHEENFPGWQWNDFVPRQLDRKFFPTYGRGGTSNGLSQGNAP
jgi:hypothetical protein